MRIRTFLLVALASTAMLAATACKRAGEAAADAAIAAASGGKVDVSHADDGTTTITSEDGKQTMTVSTGGNASLPAAFPKDVFLPANYKVESALDMPGAVITHVLTQGSVASVAADADAEMQGQGWKQAMVMAQSDEAHIVMWEKGGRHATLTIAADRAQGGVQVGYQLPTGKQ